MVDYYGNIAVIEVWRRVQSAMNIKHGLFYRGFHLVALTTAGCRERMKSGESSCPASKDSRLNLAWVRGPWNEVTHASCVRRWRRRRMKGVGAGCWWGAPQLRLLLISCWRNDSETAKHAAEALIRFKTENQFIYCVFYNYHALKEQCKGKRKQIL